MKVLESRFLRGPNVHGMAPCFVALMDFSAEQGEVANDLPGLAERLRALLPADRASFVLDAADPPERLARLLLAVQAHVGSPAGFCRTVNASAENGVRRRVVCGYRHEAVAEKALRFSIDLLTAISQRRPFDAEPRLAELRELVDARAIGPQSEALLRSAQARGIPVRRVDDDARSFALGWGVHQQLFLAGPPGAEGPAPSLDALFGERGNGRIPLVAVTGTNGKTTTTLLISHALRAQGLRTGTTTTQGIFIDGQCVETGDCSGYWSARRVLNDRAVEVATLETARGGILKRGLAFDRCDVGIVLNVNSDHLGLDGIETLDDLAHVKGLVARCAGTAAILNADDRRCIAMRATLAAGCDAVLFTMDPLNPAFEAHCRAGGSGACLDDGWLVWCSPDDRSRVAQAAALPITLGGHARFNIANALAALAALRCLGCELAAIGDALKSFTSDAQSNPLRANLFEVDGVKLIVDYAHNVVAYRALCEMARSMVEAPGRLLGVVTSPGDRRPQDLFETGQVCGEGFDELVVYEHDPRGRSAGDTTRAILEGARSAAPAKPLHGEPRIRAALLRGLAAARPGDVLVFTCAGNFDDVVEGVRLKNPGAADRIAKEIAR